MDAEAQKGVHQVVFLGDRIEMLAHQQALIRGRDLAVAERVVSSGFGRLLAGIGVIFENSRWLFYQFSAAVPAGKCDLQGFNGDRGKSIIGP